MPDWSREVRPRPIWHPENCNFHFIRRPIFNFLSLYPFTNMAMPNVANCKSSFWHLQQLANRFSLPQNFEERGHAQISWRIVLIIIVNSVIASTSGQRITVALVWSWSEWAGATITFIFVQKKFWVGYWNDATMEFWHYQAIATRISKCNMEERLVSLWWSSCIKETFIPSRLHCID